MINYQRPRHQPSSTTHSTMNIWFGKKQLITRHKFDQLSQKIRRSRTGTLDYLLSYWETNEKQKNTPVVI